MPLADCTIATTTEVLDPTMATGAITLASATVAQGANVLAAISATWAAISNPYVTGVQFDYVPHGLTIPRITTAPQPAANLQWAATDGIVSGAQYDVRWRAAGSANVFGNWSAPATVTAGVGSISASSFPPIDPANFILDPNFLDTTYWTYSGAVAPDGSTDVTTGIGAVHGIKHTASGANPQADSYAAPTVLLPCQPNSPYTLSMQQMNKSGLRGQGGIVVSFLKADGVTSVGSGTLNRGALVGTDYRTTPAAADLEETVTATVTSPALAAFMSIRFNCDWPNAAASAGVLYQAFPIDKSFAAAATDPTVAAGATLNRFAQGANVDTTTYSTASSSTWLDCTSVTLTGLPLGGSINVDSTASLSSQFGTGGSPNRGEASWRLISRLHSGGGDVQVLDSGINVLFPTSLILSIGKSSLTPSGIFANTATVAGDRDFLYQIEASTTGGFGNAYLNQSGAPSATSMRVQFIL